MLNWGMPEQPPASAFGVPVPYSAAIDELRSKIKTPGPEGWAACLALGSKPEKEALDLLGELAAREDWSYRNLAIQGLGRHPLGAQAAETIAAALADPVAQVVRTACDAVAALRLLPARSKILSLLASPDAQTRFHAVRTLAELWTDDDYPAVLALSKKDKVEFVRKEAARTLRRAASPGIWRPLFDRWKLDRLPLLRVWACELLAAFGSDKDLPQFRRLVRDPNKHVREAAEKAAAGRGFASRTGHR